MNQDKNIKMIKDRLKLFQDFTTTLLIIIENYYLDQITLGSDKDIKNHFNFCYNKVCESFVDEEINFMDNLDLRRFFYDYYYENLYTSPLYSDSSYKGYLNFWLRIFRVEDNKTQTTLEFLIDLYEIFNETIEEKKIVLEKSC